MAVETLTCAVQNAQPPNDPAFTRFPGIHNSGMAVNFPAGAGKVQHGHTGIGGSFDFAGLVNTTINGVAGLGQPAGFYTDGNVTSVVGVPASRLLEVRTVPKPK